MTQEGEVKINETSGIEMSETSESRTSQTDEAINKLVYQYNSILIRVESQR